MKLWFHCELNNIFEKEGFRVDIEVLVFFFIVDDVFCMGIFGVKYEVGLFYLFVGYREKCRRMERKNLKAEGKSSNC